MTDPCRIPSNVRFWVEDAEDQWHFEKPFDYIHARLVCTCFDKPQAVMRQAYDNLEPGGWLEFHDMDPLIHCDDETLAGTAFETADKRNIEGALRLGRDIRRTRCYKQWLIEAGFEDVVERKFKMPGNSWPKDPYAKQIGLYTAANMKEGIEGFCLMAQKKGLGLFEDEIRPLVEQATIDIVNPAVHWYIQV